MKVYDTADIRNIALVGHGDCGKTTLASTMLFVSGAVTRLGHVEEGNTVTDFDDEEIDRKISLQTALAHTEWKKKKINEGLQINSVRKRKKCDKRKYC